jgi:hypothetical protein
LLYPGADGVGNGQPVEQVDDALAAAEERAASAVARYRDLVASGPDVIAAMVQGSTVEEIDQSAEAARQAYRHISRQVVEQYERQVPTGNPARSSVSLGAETLSPEAKIALGLTRKA